MAKSFQKNRLAMKAWPSPSTVWWDSSFRIRTLSDSILRSLKRLLLDRCSSTFPRLKFANG